MVDTSTALPGKPTALIFSRNSAWSLFIAGALLISLTLFYWYRTRIPQEVTIAGGPGNGRYAQLARGLALELEQRLNIRVHVKETAGSLENLRLLEAHEADLGLYQPETQFILTEPEIGSPESANFVSNLYPEYLLPVCSADAKTDLSLPGGLIWSCNDRLSGDYAMTLLLLQHLGVSDGDVQSVPYVEVAKRLQQGDINVAIMCCGLQAPILSQLLQPEVATLVAVPAVDAMAAKNVSLSASVVPAGFFRTSPAIPAADFPTVTLQAQLLADTEASVKLIEEMTRIVADPRVQRRLGLTELFDGGSVYALQRSEFEMHPGAQHVFFPDLKPMINPDFVEGTEGLRSFIVSMLVAMWLVHRWWTRRQIRSQQHRLDRFIRALLQLELQQMDVDGEGGQEESKVLQQLLDQVTLLRQDALSEFTAHEMNEDRAVDCFIEMCHALSDKINAKLLRHAVLALKID